MKHIKYYVAYTSHKIYKTEWNTTHLKVINMC